jgi:hypothetical protein
MVMLVRILTLLTSVRVTVGYAVTLVAVATTLVVLGPGAQQTLVRHMSTNLHNLVRGHVATLLGSAFVTEDGPMYVWLPGLFCLLAVAEMLWRSRRLVLTFSLGHIGATLIVAVGLATAIRFGWTPISAAHASDVGISYGAVAVLGALTAAILPRWRPAWVGWWLAVGTVVVVADNDFTDIGHAVALGLGMLLSLRFASQPRWTPLRLGLLGVGGSFGYLMLVHAGYPVLVAPLAGAAAALTVHAAAVARRRGWQLRSSPPVAALPAEPPALPSHV